jgi:hypothetical protein
MSGSLLVRALGRTSYCSALIFFGTLWGGGPLKLESPVRIVVLKVRNSTLCQLTSFDLLALLCVWVDGAGRLGSPSVFGTRVNAGSANLPRLGRCIPRLQNTTANSKHHAPYKTSTRRTRLTSARKSSGVLRAHLPWYRISS